jgi:hypothetical protein
MTLPVDWNSRFASVAASNALRIPDPRMMPESVVALGELVGLMYRATRAPSQSPRIYLHFMETLPLLVSNLAGNQLYVVGGSYRVTARGIEG